jgi:hypothetical protein
MALDASIPFRALTTVPLMTPQEHQQNALARQMQQMQMQNMQTEMQDRQQQREQQNAMRTALQGIKPGDYNAMANALMPYDPDKAFNYAELDQKRTKEAADRKRKEQEDLGKAIAWADTPEKWDQAVDWYVQNGYADAAQLKGRFDLRDAMAAQYAPDAIKYRAEQGWKQKGYDLDVRRQSETERNNKTQIVPLQGGGVFRVEKKFGGRTEQLAGPGGKPLVAQPKQQGAAPSAEIQRMRVGLTSLDKGLTALESELSRFNPRDPRDQADTKKRARLQSLMADLQIQAKEAAALGALTGPDLDLMNKTLTDPASFGGALIGDAGVKEQIKQVRQSIQRRRQAINETYPTGQPAQQQQMPSGFNGGSRAAADRTRLDVLLSEFQDPNATPQVKAAITADIDRLVAANPSLGKVAEAGLTGRAQVKPPASGPKKGTVEGGYVFMGGNPADPKSWKKVNR